MVDSNLTDQVKEKIEEAKNNNPAFTKSVLKICNGDVGGTFVAQSIMTNERGIEGYSYLMILGILNITGALLHKVYVEYAGCDLNKLKKGILEEDAEMIACAEKYRVN